MGRALEALDGAIVTAIVTGRQKPCPFCDLHAWASPPEEAFAYGATIGVMVCGVPIGSIDAMRSVTEMMCSKHRTAFVMAMARTAVHCSAAPVLPPEAP